ncbi:hypothetical protein [Agrococcus sp. SGAir0287]|uniref:hypothetical protein n=1 Tax=Agrococcus sp. SGAir0287 TaxID=2070347 RepID=UPI0010CD1925|nr:hypothetical protein [Agrococcus sp. SGAir0287]QCR18728.1 hypothetical protein C1N71_04055 [Agrococcus sp. SGAir0287]
MPLDTITLAVVAAIVVIVLAVVAWQIVAGRKVSRARDEIVAARARLEEARAAAAATSGEPADVARANDRVQQERRAVNAATREGEALRKRFPTSLYAGRIPEPQFEEAGGGTAEPPRIAF